MREILTDIGNNTYKFLTNRIVWLMILTFALFFILVQELFYLQIVISDTFRRAAPVTTTVEQVIPASRGNIYDRFGRPLTVNNTVYVITLDPTIGISNEALLELTNLFIRNGEDFDNQFPMTNEWPYEFTLGGHTEEIRQAREFRWKDDMAVPQPSTKTAADSFLYLRDWFDIDPELSNEDVRKILNFRTMKFERRFRPHIFTVATNVSHETVAAIEERNTLFTGVGIEISTVREYPMGIYFSHILGYTGRVTDEDLAAFPDQGYADDDMIGKAGLERSMEGLLRGTRGSQIVEINPATGRWVGSGSYVRSPVPGNNIFLTIDAEMQKESFYILKDYLTNIVIRRIQGSDPREPRVNHDLMFLNLIRAGWIPVSDIMEADSSLEGAYRLRAYVLEHLPEASSHFDDRIHIRRVLSEGFSENRISPAGLLSAMVDLGVLSDYNNFRARVLSGQGTAASFVIEKLRMGELTPQMLNVDPATGQLVVLDVHTGAVLAAVSYPSYDNNMLANRINIDYYERINRLDPTTPMVNRPFMEGRAPGSTFKMITAAAGLEAGVITPVSTIHDGVAFTRAGLPAAHCWHRGGHGSINVTQAIAFSCNYFFYETSFRLGNNAAGRIDTLNRFMEFFGLDERTGVEVGEVADPRIAAGAASIMASPAFKEFTHLSRDEFTSPSRLVWADGDTIRAAIGQSYNSYSAAMMARYIAQIATRGDRFPLYIVDIVKDYSGGIVRQTNPVPDRLDMTLEDTTWDSIHQGMIWTTERGGTAVSQFRGFPIRVAGKTGTAEQIPARLSHSGFGAFAPFENPQIAVYVTVPFGDTRVMPASATQIARDVIYAFLNREATIERPLAVNSIIY